ncbi:MAG: DUF3990 domain-containing protein [Lachnospiraceae bacterium]|nr:DUF3990 domain-containing protein [Lachnospiraceae bacterium]
MKEFKIKSTIYHGTITRIENINLQEGKGYKDFGKGFYLAYDKKQSAKMMVKRYNQAKQRKQQVDGKYLYAFDTVQEVLEQCKTKIFNEADIEWLDFVLDCRKSAGTPHEYDIVIGPTADDDTNLCLNMYWEGVYGPVGSIEAKRTLLEQLEVENLGMQVFIGTEKGLALLNNKREEKE